MHYENLWQLRNSEWAELNVKRGGAKKYEGKLMKKKMAWRQDQTLNILFLKFKKNKLFGKWKGNFNREFTQFL